ncbi:hypothetical protein AAVH_25003, partial [Aphelenchoides avenae]
DHTECNRRIGELEAQLDYKDIQLHSELQRVDLLSKTVKDLRDALHSKDASKDFGSKVTREFKDSDGHSKDAFDSSGSSTGSVPTSDPPPHPTPPTATPPSARVL